MAEELDLNKIDGRTIDEILDEVDEREKKQDVNNNNDVNWDEIIEAIRNNNIEFIKNLIMSNNIDINAQNASNGKTLLIYAVIIGNSDLCQVICNFGADVHLKDNDDDDALDYAAKYGRYKITELVYYQQLSGKLGKDLKDIAIQIHQKNKECEVLAEGSPPLLREIADFMQWAINKRWPFAPDLLYYAWYYNYSVYGERPFETSLWGQMMETFEEILCNTSDKKGWKWLKKYFINSLIWYLPHPINGKKCDDNNGDNNGDNNCDNNDNADNMENILKYTLFYELLHRVRGESKNQSDKLLKDKINKIKTERENEWKQLISFNIKTKYSKTARQDLCGCLIPKYNEHDLSEEIYPPSTHFNVINKYISINYYVMMQYMQQLQDATVDIKYFLNEMIGKLLAKDEGQNVGEFYLDDSVDQIQKLNEGNIVPLILLCDCNVMYIL